MKIEPQFFLNAAEQIGKIVGKPLKVGIMKVGDLTTCITARELQEKIGIILSRRSNGPFGMKVYEVMTADGKIKSYTSAAVRPFPYLLI